ATSGTSLIPTTYQFPRVARRRQRPPHRGRDQAIGSPPAARRKHRSAASAQTSRSPSTTTNTPTARPPPPNPPPSPPLPRRPPPPQEKPKPRAKVPSSLEPLWDPTLCLHPGQPACPRTERILPKAALTSQNAYRHVRGSRGRRFKSGHLDAGQKADSKF